MKDLILIGGIPYSGKSYFCRKLVEKDPDRFIDLGLDKLYGELAADTNMFSHCYGLLPAELKKYIKVDSKTQFKFEELKKYISDLTGDTAFWQLYMQQIVNVLLIERLSKAGKGVVPVIESLFHDRNVRSGLYLGLKDLKEMMDKEGHEYDVNLYPVNKTLVYFDTSLHICLERFEQAPEQEMSREAVEFAYSVQELPSIDEMPNLTIVLVRDENNIEKLVDGFQKFLTKG